MTDTHCIAVSFDPEVHAADNRHLKVGYASRYPDYSRIPVKQRSLSVHRDEGDVVKSRRIRHRHRRKSTGDGRLHRAHRPNAPTRRVSADDVATQSGKAVGAQTKAGAGVYRGNCGESVEGVTVLLKAPAGAFLEWAAPSFHYAVGVRSWRRYN